MKLIKGNELSNAVRNEVLRAYVHRLTQENIKANPTIARLIRADVSRSLIFDVDWLKEHAFYVTNAGRLSRKHYQCEPASMAEWFNAKDQT